MKGHEKMYGLVLVGGGKTVGNKWGIDSDYWSHLLLHPDSFPDMPQRIHQLDRYAWACLLSFFIFTNVSE